MTVVAGFEVLGEKEKSVASAGNRTTFIVRPAYRRLAISNAPSWLLCWLSLSSVSQKCSRPNFSEVTECVSPKGERVSELHAIPHAHCCIVDTVFDSKVC